MTNDDRASYGRQAVEAGAPDYGPNERDGNPHANVVDALTNIMHYARKRSIDFDAAIESAWLHYESERDNDSFSQGD